MTIEGRTRGRITQRRIAELAGVSQATVSLVLNGKADALSRIPAETRERVERFIRDAEYVADPAARRLAGLGNKIIGVFTYESAFPGATQDFYTPLLAGIEAEAERLGCDLLMFTSAPVVDGRRRLFYENNRLRLADGCLLLGLEMDSTELARLVRTDFPFVAVGRRDAEGVPYIAADYVNGTAALVRRARDLGHTRFAYLHLDSTGESVVDRQRGFELGLAEVGLPSLHTRPVSGDLAADWAAIRSAHPTVLFVESLDDAHRLMQLAAADGVTVPRELSIVSLSELSRASEATADITRLRAPRERLGSEALALLSRVLDPATTIPESELRMSLPCEIFDGSTLTAPVDAA